MQKYGHSDVRDALERASARHTAVHVAAGAVAKALLAQIEITVTGAALEEFGADPAAVDAARKDRDTLGGDGRGARAAAFLRVSGRTRARTIASMRASPRR